MVNVGKHKKSIPSEMGRKVLCKMVEEKVKNEAAESKREGGKGERELES